jgi:hypothetical protein
MSSSWPNSFAAAAMDSADCVLMLRVRSKPKSSPSALRASATPSERNVSVSPGSSRQRVERYSAPGCTPSGREDQLHRSHPVPGMWRQLPAFTQKLAVEIDLRDGRRIFEIGIAQRQRSRWFIAHRQMHTHPDHPVGVQRRSGPTIVLCRGPAGVIERRIGPAKIVSIVIANRRGSRGGPSHLGPPRHKEAYQP